MPTRMTVIKKAENDKYWWESGETGTLMHCQWECKMIQHFRKQLDSFFKN